MREQIARFLDLIELVSIGDERSKINLRSESARACLTPRYSLASQLFARHITDESGEFRFRQMIADRFQPFGEIVFDCFLSILSALGIEFARAPRCVGRTSAESSRVQHLPHLAARLCWSAGGRKREPIVAGPSQVRVRDLPK
jgi:hypothetical protein